MDNEYIIHINFNEIKDEIEKLQQVDSKIVNKIKAFTAALKETTVNIEPAMKRVTHDDERELWREYQQLQREKLVVLDLSHEWSNIDQTVKDTHPKLDKIVKDAIAELTDHVTILAETHRAHIDILEIYNTRKIAVWAVVITAVISYLAVWEFFVRDLLTSIVFPYGLSPGINYIVTLISLLPIFAAVSWAWVKRRSYF
ncbi:MAG: hypothetical protein ABSA75_09805 [Candidatus Bathyarchaeia archaeon]|jgi:hypothetical protein